MTIPDRPATRTLLIGEILVQAGIVQQHQIPRALQMAQDRKLRLGEVLIMLRCLSTSELEPILEIQKLVNLGSVAGDEAIEILKVMYRDGLPLTKALDVVQEQPLELEAKKALAVSIDQELKELEADKLRPQRDLVPVLLRLGDATCDLRNYVESEQHYKRALNILAHSHGEKHLKTTQAVSRMIDLYMIQRRYLEAEPLAWKLIQIYQDAYGPEHLDLARALERLARVLDAQSKQADAEQYLLSAIRIMERQLGVEHQELQSSLRHLSAFWKRKSKQPEHKLLGEILLDADLVTNDVLASALQDSHRKSIPLGQTLLSMEAITEHVLRAVLNAQLLIQDGVVPSMVATKALHLVAHKSVEFEDALDAIGWHPDPINTEELHALLDTSEELQAAEKALGANHPGVAVIALKLGEQHLNARKFAYAENSYKRALSILKQCWGHNSIELASCLFKMANLYYVQKRYAEADSLHWQVLEIRKNALGEDHPDVASSLEGIAILQGAQGNDAIAEQMRQQALVIRTKDSARRKELAAFLKEQTVFSSLDEAVVGRVSALVEELSCTSGQVLVQDRERTEALYIVLEGTVELVRDGLASYCSAGECFGDLDSPRSTEHRGTVRVPEEARLVRISSSCIRDLKSKFPAFEQKLSEIFEERNAGPEQYAHQDFQGNLAFFNLMTVLQTIASSRNTGRLKLSNHKKEEVAVIVLKRGQLVRIKYRHLGGLFALYDLLARNDALDFVFETGDVGSEEDRDLADRPLEFLLLEAARRADELPTLMEVVGWPRASFRRNMRVLDSSVFDAEVASVAADIWILLDEGLEDNEKVADQVYSDRYTFLRALKQMSLAGYIKREDQESTGSQARLIELSNP